MEIPTPSPASSATSATPFNYSDLDNMQKEIMKWLSMWFVTGKDFSEEHPVDLVNLAYLLQGVGFTITETSVVDCPTLSENGEKVTRVSITCENCSTSTIFEKPLLEDYTTHSSDAAPSISESSPPENSEENLIPALPRETSLVLYASLNFLMDLINEESKTDSFAPVPPSIEDLIKYKKNPIISTLPFILRYIVVKPIDVSPTTYNGLGPKCRSLDSLSVIGLPEPRCLDQQHSKYLVSPTTAQNLCPTKPIESAKLEVKPKSPESIRQRAEKVQELLKEAVDTLTQVAPVVGKVTDEDVSFGSDFGSPKETAPGEMSSLKPPKTPSRSSSSPDLLPQTGRKEKDAKAQTLRTRSTGSLMRKVTPKFKKMGSRDELQRTGSKKLGDSAKASGSMKKDQQTLSLSKIGKSAKDLYAHVKSTIPKPSTSKK